MKANYSITWAEALDKVEAGEIKLIGQTLPELRQFINSHLLKDYKSVETNVLSKPLTTNTKENYDLITDGITQNFDIESVIVYDGTQNPIVIIREYEISNAFVFADVVVVPGHDAITCYDKITGESTTQHIR